MGGSIVEKGIHGSSASCFALARRADHYDFLSVAVPNSGDEIMPERDRVPEGLISDLWKAVADLKEAVANLKEAAALANDVLIKVNGVLDKAKRQGYIEIRVQVPK